MLWLQQPEAVRDSAELGMGFSQTEVSVCVGSDLAGLAWSFLEPDSLQDETESLGPLGPNPGLKCDSMGRNRKEGMASDYPHWTEATCQTGNAVDSFLCLLTPWDRWLVWSAS